MSASSKKKLRKEQNAALLTEKQQNAQKEAKKMKITTTVFVALILVVVVAFAAIIGVNAVKNSGVAQKNTIAATVGEHEINSVELNYYFNDVISNSYNEWYNSYGDSMATYMMLMGLDMSKPLDEQAYTMGEEEGQTWADYFMEAALEKAKSDYALADAAIAEGYEMTEEEQASADNNLLNMSFYAQLYGYSNMNKYLKAMYGPGSSEKTYTEYSNRSALAASYYNAYGASLEYTANDIDTYEAEKATDYNSYDYAYYYVNYTKFLPKVEADENGGTTYTDEQHEAARADAKAAAEALLKATTVEELDTAIAALEVNQGSTVASTKIDGYKGSAVAATYADWITDESRKENDIEMFTYESTVTDADGKETTTVSGYYVVIFQGMTDNARPVGNVRHLLVKFSGGTTDENGNTTYSDDEKATAKAEADGYLKTWNDGAKTEESFIELVKEHSDDSSASEGGLFENITPESSYVDDFLSWSIDENRQVGDAEVVESPYGYHVMYYVGASELNYRDMMIESDMKAEAIEEWYNGITENVSAEIGETKHIKTDIVLSAS